MSRDNVKDIGETAMVVATAAAANSELGLVAGLAVGAFKLAVNTFGTLRGRDEKRAKQLFERMAAADESPEDFLADLDRRVAEGDEEVLGALRTLIAASLEAVSPEAIAVIALLGRQHVRRSSPPWAVRGWVRLVTELSTDELAVLRELADAMRTAMENGITRPRIHEARTDDQDIALLVSPASPLAAQGEQRPRALVAMSSLYGYSKRVAAGEHADRFFMLIPQHGLASIRETWVARHKEHMRGKVQEENRDAIEVPHASAITLIRACVPELRHPALGI